MIRVLVVDDHTVVRNGYRLSLHPYDDIEIVGEASSGPLAVASAGELHPDVVLMDLRMPGGDGVTATRRIVDADGGTAVIAVTTFDADEDVAAAIDAGASGYLLKDVQPEDLAGAIRAAAAGEDALSPQVVRAVLTEFRRRHVENPLTTREQRLIRELAAGKTNSQIARTLVMEPDGVKSAITRMLAKHEVRNRTQLVAWALRHHYLD